MPLSRRRFLGGAALAAAAALPSPLARAADTRSNVAAPTSSPSGALAAGPSGDRERVRDDFAPLFRQHGADGGILLYHENEATWHVYRPERCRARHLAMSTFKIPNSLIGLESGVVPDENFVVRWDGKKGVLPEWNRDQDLASALRNSVVWYYQEVARRVGHARMRKFVDAFQYGNRDIGGSERIDYFWLQGPLTITAREQVEFLRRFYSYRLPVARARVDLVRRLLVREKTDRFTLSGKTGTSLGRPENVSWLVGYLERAADLWFFALVLTPKGNDLAALREQRFALTRAVFDALGVTT